MSDFLYRMIVLIGYKYFEDVLYLRSKNKITFSPIIGVES